MPTYRLPSRRALLRGLGLALTGAAAAPLAGCDSGGGSGGSVEGISDIALAQVARAAPDPASLPAAVAAVQAFTADLYRRLAGAAAATGNVVCSPYSVAVALAMTRNGARGTTASEMEAVLHAPPLDRWNAGLNTLQGHLDGRAGRRKRQDGSTATISLDVANSLWAQRGVTWEGAFLDALARDYGSGVHLVDYRADADAARTRINAWTSTRTHGRIPKLIPSGVLDDFTRLVLVNAIYLKAPWEQPFTPALTGDAPFTRGDGSRVTVKMMRQSDLTTGYAAGPGWQVVGLAYAGSQLAMAVIVPDPGRLGALERSLDGVALRGMLTGLAPTVVSLSLPRWTFRTQADLKAVLIALGMPTAFTDKADFSGMTTDEQLLIAAVLHEAFVAVDEEGTEAAAATAVVMQELSAPIHQVEVTADRPFLFVIHDVETGTPVFIGRVADPTAG